MENRAMLMKGLSSSMSWQKSQSRNPLQREQKRRCPKPLWTGSKWVRPQSQNRMYLCYHKPFLLAVFLAHPALDLIGLSGQLPGEEFITVLGHEDIVFNPNADILFRKIKSGLDCED